MLRIDPGVWILAALYVLIIPADWLLAAFLAAAVHEGCHLVGHAGELPLAAAVL